MRTTLPQQIRSNESGIINLDDAEGDGSHWTAYVKRKNNINYFDSYGNLRPPLEAISYFLSDGSSSKVKYNYNQLQSFKSSNCGHLCLQFLYKYA